MIARDDTNNKCRVRIAHAFHPSLKIRVRDAHPTSVCSLSCHSRPRLKHSRAGYSGNPWGTSLSGALVSFEDGCPARAKWIPAFAGMTRKCRVRIAHAALASAEVVGLMSRHRGFPANNRTRAQCAPYDSSHAEL